MSGVSSSFDPVILDILPRREMAVAAVVFVGDVAEHAHLGGVERAIGDGDTQHVGVELQVQAVHQPQRPELVFRQAAVEPAAYLVAELGDTRVSTMAWSYWSYLYIRSPS